MPSLSGLLSTLCDQLLALVPDPAAAKRLDDIDTGSARARFDADASSDPSSSVRPKPGASSKRAAS